VLWVRRVSCASARFKLRSWPEHQSHSPTSASLKIVASQSLRGRPGERAQPVRSGRSTSALPASQRSRLARSCPQLAADCLSGPVRVAEGAGAVVRPASRGSCQSRSLAQPRCPHSTLGGMVRCLGDTASVERGPGGHNRTRSSFCYSIMMDLYFLLGLLSVLRSAPPFASGSIIQVRVGVCGKLMA
jgi:hypothetical protein